jgi:hypothetical protein
MKIISGGQTGVDRAALDVAMKHRVDCGGWCPAGRLDELGKIPDGYPVQELEKGSFAERTMRNVSDSDGTVIVYRNELGGGTEFTLECCKQLNRPHLLIDAAQLSPEEASRRIAEFVGEHHIETLNIAGPRQSEWPEGYQYAAQALEEFLAYS